MRISKQELKYFIRNFRTKRDYMIFQIFQLLLALIIVVSALSNINHFKAAHVLWMELILLITMAIDLFIIRYVSEGGFRLMTKGIMGKIDLIVFAIFALTLLFLALNTDEEQESILQTDDIIIILIVVSRYLVQIYRMVTSIKQTHENREMNKQIKQIDLNAHENISTVYNKQIQHENALKNRITQNFMKKQNNNFVEQEEENNH